MVHYEIRFLKGQSDLYPQVIIAKSEREKREIIYNIEKHGYIIIGVKQFDSFSVEEKILV